MLSRCTAVLALAGSAAAFSPMMSMDLGRREVLAPARRRAGSSANFSLSYRISPPSLARSAHPRPPPRPCAVRLRATAADCPPCMRARRSRCRSCRLAPPPPPPRRSCARRRPTPRGRPSCSTAGFTPRPTAAARRPSSPSSTTAAAPATPTRNTRYGCVPSGTGACLLSSRASVTGFGAYSCRCAGPVHCRSG